MKVLLTGSEGTLSLGETYVVETGKEVPFVRMVLSRELDNPRDLFAFSDTMQRVYHGTMMDFQSDDPSEKFFVSFNEASFAPFVTIPMNESVTSWMERARKSDMWIVELATKSVEVGFLVRGDEIVSQKRKISS